MERKTHSRELDWSCRGPGHLDPPPPRMQEEQGWLQQLNMDAAGARERCRHW